MSSNGASGSSNKRDGPVGSMSPRCRPNSASHRRPFAEISKTSSVKVWCDGSTGGAVPIERLTFESALSVRATRRQAQKNRIAARGGDLCQSRRIDLHRRRLPAEADRRPPRTRSTHDRRDLFTGDRDVTDRPDSCDRAGDWGARSRTDPRKPSTIGRWRCSRPSCSTSPSSAATD